jgi:hypothetical protein
MKKRIKNWILLFIIAFSGFLADGVQAQEARLDKIWVDFDVYRQNQKGMLIHLKFTVIRMKNVDASVRIMFKNKANDEFLPDRNRSYYTNTGYVAVFRTLQIDYDPGYYDDLQIFMPYEELDLSPFPGRYELSMDVDVIYTDTGELISHLTFYGFEYFEPEMATVERVWVDYNVTQGGKKGMLVHVKMRVKGLKQTNSYLAIYFEKIDGQPVKGKSLKFRTKDGSMTGFIDLKPCFDVTFYDDLSIFIPYDEFALPPGKHTLRMHFDIHYENGELFQHLTYYEFEFLRSK